MFVFVSDVMKKIVTKISFVVCLLSMVALLFTACSEKDIYAENSDFESYPDYWNSFNQNTTGDDLYIVDPSDKTTIAGDNSAESGSDKDTSSNTSSEVEDWTANFVDDEDNDDNSNDNSNNSNSSNDNGNGNGNGNGSSIPDDEENKNGNQGPLVFF